tara:strand:+ start:269 stop:2122 length:1854 start_codon:yes stop_codon:yes gene_type:complete
MPETKTRSIQLGYRYFWDISQRERASWHEFHRGDYEFKRRQGYTSAAGERIPAGVGKGPAAGMRLKGGEGTFNLQPRAQMRAQIGNDDKDALEYQRKRLFSWSLFHHGDSTAALFSLNNKGNGIIPTEESTTTEGGGRGGPREVSREEGLKKFFWGMLKSYRPQISYPENRGNTNTGFSKADSQAAGSKFVADRIASDDSKSMLGKYQRDILPKAIWQMKKLTEERMNVLVKLMPNIIGTGDGAQKTLGTMSEEELGILVMERIGDVHGKTEAEARQAVREAVASYPKNERRRELDGGGQKTDIDPKYNPTAAANLDRFFKDKAGGALGGTFLGDLEAHKGGGYEVSMVENRLQAYYRLKRSNFLSTEAMVAQIAKEMEADILKPTTDVGHGMKRRIGNSSNFKTIYTTQMGTKGLAIYMVSVTNGVPAVIPYVWRAPNDSLLNEMVLGIAGEELKDTVISELKAAQLSDLRHETEGSIVIRSRLDTSLQQIDWLGTKPGPGGTAYGGQPRGGMNVRSHVSIVAQEDLADSVFQWAVRGAEELNKMVIIKENSKLYDFMQTSQIMAETAARYSEHKAKGGWKKWVGMLEGNYTPTPQQAPGWAQFLHPRPYIKEDTF